MSVLFVGDSQLKYLHHVQLEDNTAVRCTSGFSVEQIWALFSGIVKDHDIIVLHAGTNNVPREEPSTTLHRYQHLLKIIWTSNPTARIIASAVLPRDYNVFEGARNNVGYIDGCNRRAQEINDGLKMIASRSTQLEFCPHPSFGVDRRTANRRLLSRDGLHLTRRGIQQLHDDIQVLVSRIRSSLCVRAPTCQPESVCEDREDPIPTDYRDALLRTTQPTVIPEFTADLDDEIIWPSLPRVSVSSMSRASAPVPSVCTSVSRASAPIPSVRASASPRSAPVPSVRASVSRASAHVPSLSSVSCSSAPIPSVRTSVHSWTKVTASMKKRCLRKSRVEDVLSSVLVSCRSATIPSVHASVCRDSAPIPSVRASVCRRSAPVPCVRTSVCRDSAPIPSVRASVSRRSAPVPSVRASVCRVSVPTPSVPCVSHDSVPTPSVRTSVSRVRVSRQRNSVLKGGGVIVYGLEVVMEQQQIVKILQNPELSKVSEIPPVKPKGGETYVIKSLNADDWRCDQYQ